MLNLAVYTPSGSAAAGAWAFVTAGAGAAVAAGAVSSVETASDVLSAVMIYVIALGVMAIWPLFFTAPFPPAGSGLIVAVLFLIGLRPLTAKITAIVDAVTHRIKHGGGGFGGGPQDGPL